MKKVSKFVFALIAVLALVGFSLPAFAQTAHTAQSTEVVSEYLAVQPVATGSFSGQPPEIKGLDLRVEVYNLLSDMSNVRDGESWVRWINQWNSVVRTQYAAGDINKLAYGQVVKVPESPADWSYVDWESVPYEARPSVALSHACGLMTGRVYGGNELRWDANEDLMRYEAANIAARTIELVFEAVLNTATYSRPGCPLAMEAFHGDPEMFKDLIERQAVRHDEVVAELRAAILRLEGRPDLSDEVRRLIRQDLDLRVEFQAEMSSIVRDINARWDELKSEIGSLWIVLAEYDDKLAELKQDILAQVWALCAQGACRGEEGPRGPRGLQGPVGPQGPAGKDADWDEFYRMRDEMEKDFVTTSTLDYVLEGYVTRTEFVEDQRRQDVTISSLDARVTALENAGRITLDDCPVWLNFTGNPGVGEFTQTNPYLEGMEVSANVGVDATAAAEGVQMVAYNVGQGNRPNNRSEWWKESAWYETLPAGTTISVTARDRTGETCTRTHTLPGR